MRTLRDMLIAEEGRREVAYIDSEGIATIGVGHTGPEVHIGLVWSDAKIDRTLDDDIAEASLDALDAFPWLVRLNEARRAVLIGMVFQMGLGRVRGFKKTLQAMEDERWHDAAGQMLDSLWAKQTPKRANRMAHQMETGEWA